MTASAFQHERLRLSENSIRLVQIHGTSTTTASSSSKTNYSLISLRITQYAIHKRPPYAAISYTWGSATDTSTRTITVNGRPFRVHANLWHLLHHLRQRGESRFLWVDALCIDQANLAERNFHVQLMGKIYDEADFAIVWLGLPSDERWEARAMDFLAEMATYRQGRTGAGWKDVFLAEKAGQRWVNLVRFCKCRYWTRTWIIQEFLQAKRIEVLCGTAKLEWDLFGVVLTIVRELTNVPEYLAVVLADFVGSVPSRLTSRRLSRQGSLLQELIHEFYDAECTEPRDKVYGMLGIAADCGQDPATGGFRGPQPDYSKHIVEVYFDVCSYLRDSSPLACVTPLTILLLQESLGITKDAISHYLSTLNDTTLPLKLIETSLCITPDYASIIEDTFTWTSIRDLKQKLETFDWAKYVGYEIQRKRSRQHQYHQRLASFSSTERIRSPLPQDLIANAIDAAENTTGLTAGLYNYPIPSVTFTPSAGVVEEAFHVHPTTILLHDEDKRLASFTSAIQKPTLIIEQSAAANPVRVGFACTNVRKGDVLVQFQGLNVAFVGRRTSGSGLKLVGKAFMARHIDLTLGGAVHPVCGNEKYSSPCLEERKREEQGLEQGELQDIQLHTDPLTLFELLR